MRHLAKEILSADGPIARVLGESFEARPQQGEMADLVERTLAGQSRAVIEAGTGVGKSFAYLVPAMVRCLTTNERVVVATNTIALQEQIVGKDIPFLVRTLEESGKWGLGEAARTPLMPALVKGRGNYLSLRRLKLAGERATQLFPDAAQMRSLEAIEAWAYQTLDGTLSSLPPLERPGVWDRAQSDTDNCMGRKCPTFEQCFYQRARRKVEAANLLVCNHALFCADLNLRAAGVPGVLPAYQHVIIDEAHALEDVACEHFGLSLTESRVEHLLGVLYHHRTGKGYLPVLGKSVADHELIDRAHESVMDALEESRRFFDGWVELVRRGGAPSGRLRSGGMVKNTLSPAMTALAARLKLLKEKASAEADKFELNAYAVRAEAIAFDAEVLTSQSRVGSVYWLESGQEGESTGSRGLAGGGGVGAGGVGGGAGGGRARAFKGKTRLKLACSPIDVAPMLRQHLFEREVSAVLTSATLALPAGVRVRPIVPPASGTTDAAEADERAKRRTSDPPIPPAFSHVASRLGLDRAAAAQLGSPFNHAHQAEVFVDLSAPEQGATRGAATRGRSADRGDERAAPAREHARRLALRIDHHVGETDGGAFVLFTSFATIEAVTEFLEPLLERRRLPMLVQGRDGPPGAILERFRADERSVLLGAASFWQGVDVRGRGLRNVIITKLPFDPPDRPIVEARGELIKSRGGNAFAEDALPRAVLRFKQGFGRLVRSASDFGRVVILDGRVLGKAYGRVFLDAIPKGVRVQTIHADDEQGGGGEIGGGDGRDGADYGGRWIDPDPEKTQVRPDDVPF